MEKSAKFIGIPIELALSTSLHSGNLDYNDN